MFDFLSDEVFQIVVITALFVIGVILFMLYKRPSENIAQYMDDIDYRIEKINKKLDDLTNTFVNGLMIDEDETDVSSVNDHNEGALEEALEEAHKGEQVNSLNYDGIEFSDIPNFSTDTSVVNEVTEIPEDVPDVPDVPVVPVVPVVPENIGGKKKVNIIKRIIQSDE